MSARPFPALFYDGVRRFAAGEFFEAHEAFEECMEAVESDERWDLLVALVQVAVGYHKLSSGHPGAERMLGLGHEKLLAFPDVAFGVAVAALRTRIASDRRRPSAETVRDDPPRIELV
jgi:predicted metal-dependent hydrolase